MNGYNFTLPRGAKGTMPIEILGVPSILVGGPYRMKPSHMHGVKMAVEIDAPCDVSIPTEDFSVPDKDDLRRGLQKAVHMILDGKVLWIGCMGGIGRTGLFLAALAKLQGEDDPVAYVREHYYPHAVETGEQRAYIDSLNVDGLITWPMRVKAMWFRFKRLVSI